MTISYPLALPAGAPARIQLIGRDVAGMSESPFDASQQIYDWRVGVLRAQIQLPIMTRADAEAWVAWLLSLYGTVGTFLMGGLSNTAPRGTWAGSPVVSGAHAAQLKALALTGFTAGATGKVGDWLQVGTGASARLHKNLTDFTANGSGNATLDVWPPLTAALVDTAAVVSSSPVGCWRRTSNECPWDIDTALFYGISFEARAAL